MMILTRKKGEVVCIGDGIRVKVLGYHRLGGVRLGIEAPPEVAVDREEVRQKKLRRAKAEEKK